MPATKERVRANLCLDIRILLLLRKNVRLWVDTVKVDQAIARKLFARNGIRKRLKSVTCRAFYFATLLLSIESSTVLRNRLEFNSHLLHGDGARALGLSEPIQQGARIVVWFTSLIEAILE